MSKTVLPTIRLNNNTLMPVLGLGTSQAKPGEMLQIVKDAIDVGYRSFDTSVYYGNEHEVGQAIKEKIAEGPVKREELFVTNKLWGTYHREDLVVPACKKTLEAMSLDYLDLYLIHFPVALKEGDVFDPKDENGKLIYSDADYVDTWREMEKCVELGLVKSIGLSNFNSQQIDRVLEIATIKPVVNQVECHPYFNQSKLINFCKEREIAIMAYAPFGRPGSKVLYVRQDAPLLFEDPKLQEVASKHGKTVPQVILRYLIQHEVAPIPKTSNKDRLQQNTDVFDFELSSDEVTSIDALDVNIRIFICPQFMGSKNYPFYLEF
ncbi:1,5-anhydro-D-fructose reductase-like isoform X1 [Periplaneta americana]|uniref:1,5-anhydro-D-fructose reductase-like isoform X1 n=1 Tax=Periplaneta americana TaxID=6978 RepID=UPI0037E8ADB4